MICRDEPDSLTRCLESVIDVIDELSLVIDSRDNDMLCESVAHQFSTRVAKCHIQTHEWDETLFQGARKKSFEPIESEAILWLDCDDEILDKDRIRQLAVEKIINGDCDEVRLPYNYSQNERGEKTNTLFRERIVRRNCHRWSPIIHEILKPTAPVHLHYAKDEIVLHHEKVDESENRHERIFTAYSKMREDEHPEFGERELGYLVGCALERNDKKLAGVLFKDYFARYGHDTQSASVYQKRIAFSQFCRMAGDLDQAILVNWWCLQHRPEEGLGYIHLGMLLQDQGNHREALEWFEIGSKKGATLHHHGMSTNPTAYDYEPKLAMARSHIHLDHFDEAQALVEYAKERWPGDERWASFEKSCTQYIGKKNMIHSYAEVLRDMGMGRLPHDSESDNCVNMSISHSQEEVLGYLQPDLAVSDEFGLYFYRQPMCNQVVFLYEQNVAIDPENGLDAGCGGSEHGLIVDAEGLARRGWDVHIYAVLTKNGLRRKVNGVHYACLEHFQWDKPHGIVVGMRNHLIFDRTKAEAPYKRVFHFSDVVPADSLTGRRSDVFDHLVVKTEDHAFAHRQFVKEENLSIIPYGVPLEEYSPASPIRNPYRCFYSSRPERGLHRLLKLWPEIKRREPRAELVLIWGIDGVAKDFSKSMPGYRDMLQACIQLIGEHTKNGLGVRWCGTVLGAERTGFIPRPYLHAVMATSGVWIYPTSFIETFCITAIEAQLSGCIPVANCIGALQQTVAPWAQIRFPAWEEGADDTDEILQKQAEDQFVRHVINSMGSELKVREALVDWASQFSLDANLDAWERLLYSLGASKVPLEEVLPVV